VATISEIISIVRKSLVRFVFQYAPSYVAKVSYFEKDPHVYFIQQCYEYTNRVRRQL